MDFFRKESEVRNTYKNHLYLKIQLWEKTNKQKFKCKDIKFDRKYLKTTLHLPSTTVQQPWTNRKT